MSNPSSETIHAEHVIYGRTINVTLLTWPDTDRVSFDVTDAATDVLLHDESFDDAPSFETIRSMVQELIEARLAEEPYRESALNDEAAELNPVIDDMAQARDQIIILDRNLVGMEITGVYLEPIRGESGKYAVLRFANGGTFRFKHSD